jgi:hypothetical protein
MSKWLLSFHHNQTCVYISPSRMTKKVLSWILRKYTTEIFDCRINLCLYKKIIKHEIDMRRFCFFFDFLHAVIISFKCIDRINHSRHYLLSFEGILIVEFDTFICSLNSHCFFSSSKFKTKKWSCSLHQYDRREREREERWWWWTYSTRKKEDVHYHYVYDFLSLYSRQTTIMKKIYM